MKPFDKARALRRGKTITSKEPGNSMTPLLVSRQSVTLVPIQWQEAKVGDIVFCRVNGRYYTHLVKATSAKTGCLIGNNHGHINGWTKHVYGLATK